MEEGRIVYSMNCLHQSALKSAVLLTPLVFLLAACGYQGSLQVGMEELPQTRSSATSSPPSSSPPDQTQAGSLVSKFGDFIRGIDKRGDVEKELEATTGGKTPETQDGNRSRPKETLGEKPVVRSGVIRELTTEEPAILYLTTESEEKTVVFDKRYASVNSYADAKGNLQEQFSFAEVDPQTLIGKLAVVVQTDRFVTINLYPEDTPKGPVLY